jgi:hypothetical protein
MRIAELRALFSEQGGEIDWERARDEIRVGHKHATSTRQRIAHLKLYHSIMDAVERETILPAGLPEFRRAGVQGYRLLLLREAVGDDVGVGLMDPGKILQITAREVRAGRLDPKDDLHKLALRGAAPSEKQGVIAKMLLRK